VEEGVIAFDGTRDIVDSSDPLAVILEEAEGKASPIQRVCSEFTQERSGQRCHNLTSVSSVRQVQMSQAALLTIQTTKKESKVPEREQIASWKRQKLNLLDLYIVPQLPQGSIGYQIASTKI
jgi:hypothetical protein